MLSQSGHGVLWKQALGDFLKEVVCTGLMDPGGASQAQIAIGKMEGAAQLGLRVVRSGTSVECLCH
jgi:hypothetical protein